MKKGLLIAFTCLFIALFTTASLSAQESTPPAVDQEIETLEKRLAELKQRKREELQRRVKALQEQLNQLERDKGETQSKLSPEPQSPPRTAADDSAPRTNASASGNGEAAAAPAANSNPQATSSNQVDNKCFWVLQEPSKYSRADQAVCFLARDIVDRRIEGVTPGGIDLTSDQGVLLPALFSQIARRVTVDAAVKSFVLDLEASRTDKQLGADPKSSGTTSLAVKGGIPSVLSWAVENGAAVASRDGTTVTFRVNPVGTAEALSGQGYVSGFRNSQNDPVISFLRRTSLGFSFDTTRGTDPPTFIGSKQQLSAVSFRYQFINQRDPRHQQYQRVWDQFIEQQGLAFTKQQSDRLKELEAETAGASFRNQDLQRWVDATNAALGRASIVPTNLNKVVGIEEVRKIIEQRLAELPTSELEKDPALINALTGFVSAYLPYIKEKRRILDEISKGTLVTFEYTNHREANAPDLSNFRFIAEKGTLGGFDITANASLTFYNRRPAGTEVKRIRDFSFAAQLDKKLDDVMGLGNSTLSFAGKFERLTSNAVALDGTVLPNTKGDIAVGQIKLTIPIKDTGIKIPFSVTWANRTELVREKEVRGNFGFTLDFDTLFARFKPFSR